jgi:beta-mannanase
MLDNFNDGRSKSYYCIAATVMEIKELEEAMLKAIKDSNGLDVKDKSRILHKILDGIAEKKEYNLRLRK